MLTNALTIDVEDYYNVFARDRLGIDGPPTKAVVRNTQQVLAILKAHGTRATFFFLAEVAERFPSLVEEVVAAGHEIGLHGYRHDQIFKLSREEFTDQVARGRDLLADVSGCPVEGFRAPAFSIRPDTAWALDILAEMGFRYDSSVFPIPGGRYGWDGFRLDIHRMDLPCGLEIVEAPASAVSILGKRLPACGGGYLRHFPYWYTRWAMNRITKSRPAIVYVHPYELDLADPPSEFAAALASSDSPTRRFHRDQLRNRGTVRNKLVRLLSDFDFAPLGKIVSGVVSGNLKPPDNNADFTPGAGARL